MSEYRSLNEELNIYNRVMIPWFVTLGQTDNRQQYQAIISGLLTEVLKHHKSRRREAMNFVLDRWNYTSENNNLAIDINDQNAQKNVISIATISKLLKTGITLSESGWLIALTGGIILSFVGFTAINLTNELSQLPHDISSPPTPGTTPDQPTIENGIPLFTDVTVKDIDSPNFDQGTLTIKFAANSTASDRLIIRNQGKNSGLIGVDAANITYGGAIIGSFTGGDGINPLVIKFNAQSSPDIAQTLLHNIYYRNISNNTSPGSRTLQVQLNNGKENGDSNILSRNLIVTTENKEPIINIPAQQTIKENTSLTISGITIADPDSSKLTVNLTVNKGILNIKSDVAEGLKADDILKNGTNAVTLKGTATQINSTLANPSGITYKVNQDFIGEDVLKINVNDGGKIISGKTDTSIIWPTNALKAKISSNSLQVTINPLKNPPEITVPNQQTVKVNTSLGIPNIKINNPSNDNLTVTFSVRNGKLTIKPNVPQGVIDKKISKNSTPIVTISGTVAEINSTLNDSSGIIYISNQDFNGNDILAITASNGGKKNGIKTIPITVKPLNHPPVLSIDETKITDNGISITKEEAVNVIKKYMASKNTIFAPPYDRRLAASLTTGKIYEDIIKYEGSLDWLQSHNAYYQFSQQITKPLDYFTVSGNQVNIDVRISEQVYYYEYGSLKSNKLNDKSYRFTLQFEDNIWKIADRKSLDS